MAKYRVLQEFEPTPEEIAVLDQLPVYIHERFNTAVEHMVKCSCEKCLVFGAVRLAAHTPYRGPITIDQANEFLAEWELPTIDRRYVLAKYISHPLQAEEYNHQCELCGAAWQCAIYLTHYDLMDPEYEPPTEEEIAAYKEEHRHPTANSGEFGDFSDFLRKLLGGLSN